jgi:Ca2+-transporting ATPase
MFFKDELQAKHQRVDEVPFDSDRKLMTTVNIYDDQYYVLTKGAIDNLLKITKSAYINGEIVPLTEEIKRDNNERFKLHVR